MRRDIVRVLVVPILVSVSAFAYVRVTSNKGIPLFRRDVTNIQFYLNPTVKAGAVNSAGGVIISPSSDPAAAITAATNAWSSISGTTIHFAPLQSTTLHNNPSDGKSVITAEDTAETRSIVGSYLAITLWRYDDNGALTDTDILINPNVDFQGFQAPLSTDHALDSFDLQSLLTHELGHALGANHSGLVSATMYQTTFVFSQFSTVAESTMQSNLSPDDIAFARAVYPAPSFAAQNGSISGKAAYTDGSPIFAGSVVAVDTATGLAIGGVTSTTDGSYSIDSVPPGTYTVYIEPLDGPVFPANLYFSAGTSLTTSFRTTVAAQPAVVTAGGNTAVDFSVDTAASGMDIPYLGTGPAGGTAYSFAASAKTARAGSAIDVLVWGKGIDASNQVTLLGPGISVRPGTLHIQPGAASGGLIPIRFTVDVAARSTRAFCSVLLRRAGDAAAYSGGFVIVPVPSFPANGIVNAANYTGGFVSPGEIVSVFGQQFGPVSLVGLQLGSAGNVLTQLAETRILFDGIPAPLIYSAAGVLSAIVPYEVAGQTSTNVRVEYQGTVSATVTVPVSPAAPAIFTSNASGMGQGAILNQDQTINDASNAAAAGSVIVFYATGEGQTNPGGVTGSVTNNGTTKPVLPVSVTIGGITAEILYAGEAPGLVAGVLQVNARIPANVAKGNSVPVSIAVGTAVGGAGVTVAVR